MKINKSSYDIEMSLQISTFKKEEIKRIMNRIKASGSFL